MALSEYGEVGVVETDIQLTLETLKPQRRLIFGADRSSACFSVLVCCDSRALCLLVTATYSDRLSD